MLLRFLSTPSVGALSCSCSFINCCVLWAPTAPWTHFLNCYSDHLIYDLSVHRSVSRAAHRIPWGLGVSSFKFIRSHAGWGAGSNLITIADCTYLFTTPRSVAYFEIGHSGVFTPQVLAKKCKSGLFMELEKGGSQLLNIYQLTLIWDKMKLKILVTRIGFRKRWWFSWD